MAVLLSDGSISEPPREEGPGLFRLAFRPFFLGGALFSVLAVLLWSSIVSGGTGLNVYGGGLWWHGHEMLFGFVAAIVVGFLLTAVQTWTGITGIKGRPLAALFLLWLCARLALVLPALVPLWLTISLDLLFLPLAAVLLSLPVIRIRQWRNIVFVPVLLAMAAANGASHVSVVRQDPALQAVAFNFMVMLVSLLITVVAGRVVPMFTANGTGTERVPPLPWLERLCLLSMLLAIPAAVWMPDSPAIASLALFFAAACHGLRVLRWRTWVTLATPLVWSLHLSYWALVLGLGLLGVSRLSDSVSLSQALHVLTVGGMGLMILAMISRVSLGHTGRTLQVGPVMVVAYLSLLAALILRVSGQWWLADYRDVIIGSALLWAVAYGLFFVRYLPILASPRPDGRPG
ncbi:NnrS family protein [Seongchinamella unica]|uniref:NnrS family protein n=1 Tax=Seongchinamella unica TaxID=2547392 RepID=A0A4V2ZXQ7_9GAMM|nr:NnrS family protein [Seongchinamella unica]TDG15935.1 NnrS family protein [Seongchinamella unica]